VSVSVKLPKINQYLAQLHFVVLKFGGLILYQVIDLYGKLFMVVTKPYKMASVKKSKR